MIRFQFCEVFRIIAREWSLPHNGNDGGERWLIKAARVCQTSYILSCSNFFRECCKHTPLIAAAGKNVESCHHLCESCTVLPVPQFQSLVGLSLHHDCSDCAMHAK